MDIIAHRGIWYKTEEKNSFNAIREAIDNVFGVEIDIRDYCGNLVVSHDIADESCVSLAKVFQYYNEVNSTVQLALNIKADGIQKLLISLLNHYKISNYFLFDMSIPELVVNEKEKLNFYTRHSDIESECVLYDKAAGIWLDSFYDEHWLKKDIIKQHIFNNKPVCIISPEIHGYDYMDTWNIIRSFKNEKYDMITLCTDIPDKAKEFFNGKNKSNII